MSKSSYSNSDNQKRENFLSALALLLTSQKMQMDVVLDIVQLINSSMQIAKECIIVLEEVFLNEKSGKILFTVDVLEYLVKNCNRNFHQAANSKPFMQSMLRLLRRQRGKFTIVEKLRSNVQNWVKIEAKILYIIQLWYDAFMLEESQYSHIISTYKMLRQENILFPPRQQNEKNMLSVKTNSPIFDHITEISQQDMQKFQKKKKALGLTGNSQIEELEKADRTDQRNQPVMRYGQQTKVVTSKPTVNNTSDFDLTEVQELIAIIRSLDYLTSETNQSYQKLKLKVETHRKPKFKTAGEERMYQQIFGEAEKVIKEWQGKYKENLMSQEEEYMRQKLSGIRRGNNSSPEKQQSINPEKHPEPIKYEVPKESVDLLDL